MRRVIFVLVFTVLSGVFAVQAQTATPTLPICATPGPTATPTPTYRGKILSYSPFAYWTLTEGAGTIAIDETGNGRHATYSGVTLNAAAFTNGDRAPGFDGVNDFISIFSAINGVFNPAEGTITGWARPNASVYTDGANNRIVNIQATTTLNIGSGSSISNGLVFTFGGLTRTLLTTTTDWFQWGVTWSQAGNFVRYYANGSLFESSTYQAWSGSLAIATLGATNTSGNFPWFGNLSHVAMWTTPLSNAQIADLAVVPAAAPVPTATPVCQAFNPTPTPTPDFYVYFETPDGEPARMVREIAPLEVGTFLALVAILVLFFLVYARDRLKGGGR